MPGVEPGYKDYSPKTCTSVTGFKTFAGKTGKTKRQKCELIISVRFNPPVNGPSPQAKLRCSNPRLRNGSDNVIAYSAIRRNCKQNYN